MARVLALTLFYPPHHFGGYEIACQSALQELTQRGHTVEVLTSDLERAEGGPDDPAIPVTRALRRYIDGDDLLVPAWRERLATERHNQRALAERIDRFAPDVISVWHMGALSQGLLTTIVDRDLPAIAMIADDWLIYGLGLDPWMSRFVRDGRGRLPGRMLGGIIERVTGVPAHLPDFGAHAGVLYTSQDNRARAQSRGRWRFPRGAVSYLGIDLAAFGTPEARDGRSPAPRSRRLLYAGRCDPRKGVATVLDAVALLPDVELELRMPDGDNAHGRELRDRAHALGIDDRITWGEAVDQRALAVRMAAASVVVFPSEWPEPFGLVPLEAMACGTPVAATGVGGSGEFLRADANCGLFAPGDAHDLARVLRRILDDPEHRERLIANGLTTARYFSRQNFTDVVEAWHLAAAAGFPDGAPAGRDFSTVTLPRPVDPEISS